MKTMGLPFQPHVVLIMEDTDKIGEKDGAVVIAVVQSNLFYEVPTVMAAVDTCLKFCYAFGLLPWCQVILVVFAENDI